MRTKQETFDTVVNHLRNQNKKAEAKEDDGFSSKCMYRLGNLKCAAGCLLPDDKYKKEFEGLSILPSKRYLEDSTYPEGCRELSRIIADEGHDLELVKYLQSIHDGFPVEQWEINFQDAARHFNLEYKEKKNDA